jgi:NADPH-dependent curcumin reductase CurA
MPTTNRQVRLAARPDGLPTPDVWDLTEEQVPEPGPGQVHVEVSHLSLDPAMRGWMNDVPSYVPPVALGDVMRAGGVGRVVASRSDSLAEGTYVSGMLGVQQHAVLDADGLYAVDPEAAPLPTYLGALGMTGMTAYFGLLDVGALREGDTVVVSGAAGAVGSIVGQIAKIKGARAVGIAGGPEKCAWVVDQLGFDACIDYKAQDLRAGLQEHAPDRIDVFFDNVGGETLDVALARLARGARVVLCGAISQYNERVPVGPRNYMSLLVQRARMEGFVVFDFAARYGEAARQLAAWRAENRLVAREDVVRGTVDSFPDTFLRLFRGENVGKLVLELG